MNFGTILNSVTNSCIDLMLESRDSESKSKVRDFTRYVKLKEVLRKQFYVYNQLNSSYVKDIDSAKIFVNETLSIMDKFSFEDILSYNHLLETKFNVDKIETTELNKAISKAIRYRTSVEKNDQMGYIDSLNKIVEHVSTYRNSKNEIVNENLLSSQLKFLKPKHVMRIAIKKFNNRYSSNFDEEDRRIFNTLREGNEKALLSLYNERIEILNTISPTILNEIGDDLSLKLKRAMEKISSGYTQENLLDAYELSSELERLGK